MHHNEVKLKACNVAQHSWESRPILNVEQPEAVEDSKIALNNPGCIVRAHPTAALSDSGLTKLSPFVSASRHTEWPRLRFLDYVTD